MTFGYWGWGDWPYGYSSYPYASSGSYPLTLSGITGEMRLDVTPKDADVYVDGYYAGVVSDFNGTFHHLSVTAGPHVVEFRKDGMETLAVPVFIQPNHTTTYRGSMLPAQPGSSVEETMLPGAPAAGASPWAAPGDLRFDVTPGSAQVYVDGYFVGAVNDFEGRRQRLSLAPGTHHVALQAPGYESTEGDVTIEPRQTTTYKETLAHVKP